MPSLHWLGKDKVINHHLEVPFRVLDEQYSFGTPNGNAIIHGDNLDALKALLPQYEGRVNCIYIDPPYNTGNEGWIYNDNVNDPKIKKWLGDVVGREGEDLTRHDKWLCMMYPRLRLLQRLMANDGAIYISIDDTEVGNLRGICDEIFGSRNFLADAVWEKSDSPRMDAKLFSTRHDHTIIYAKNIDALNIHKLSSSAIAEHYNKTDAQGRLYYLKPLRAMGQNDAREARPNLFYAMTAPDGTEVFPIRTDGSDGNWRWSRDKVEAEADRIEWVNGRKGWMPYYKIFAEDQTERPPETIWYNREVGSNRTAMAQLKAIFGNGKAFTTPKPVGLIERILELSTENDGVILDSFAGSGTTAHAVLNMNQKDGGNRQFILVEMEDYTETITAERVRRVVNGYGEGKNAVPGTGGGFTYYELGKPLLLEDGLINEALPEKKIREYIYYTETREPLPETKIDEPYLLGVHAGTAYYFNYEKECITTLNRVFLDTVQTRAEAYLIYADLNALSDEEMERFGITFKKIPRDIKKL